MGVRGRAQGLNWISEMDCNGEEMDCNGEEVVPWERVQWGERARTGRGYNRSEEIGTIVVEVGVSCRGEGARTKWLLGWELVPWVLVGGAADT